MLAIAVALSLGQTDPALPERLLQRPSSRAEVAAVCHPGSAWWKANANSPASVASCELALRTLATDAHTEAQQNKRRAFYLLASQRYRAYLTVFGSGEFLSDHAFNLTYYFAEVLWALDAFEEAISEYQRVVTFEIPDRKDAREISQEKYRSTADFNTVLAWEKLVQRERGLLRPSDRFDCPAKPPSKREFPIGARPVELSRLERELVRATDAYLARHGGEPACAGVAFEAAALFAERGEVAEATRRLQSLVERYPDQPERARASRLLARLRR